MNLWSWPFLTTGTAVDWDPAADAATNLRHYLTFYAASSFAWDTFRAVGNAALVLLLGRPLLGALDRAARRMARGGPVASWAMTQALSDRTHIHRHPERGDHDRATIHAVLDEALLCTVSWVDEEGGRGHPDDPGADRRHAVSARIARRPGMEGGRRRRRSASWPRWSTSSCSPARPRRTR